MKKEMGVALTLAGMLFAALLLVAVLSSTWIKELNKPAWLEATPKIKLELLTRIQGVPAEAVSPYVDCLADKLVLLADELECALPPDNYLLTLLNCAQEKNSVAKVIALNASCVQEVKTKLNLK